MGSTLLRRDMNVCTWKELSLSLTDLEAGTPEGSFSGSDCKGAPVDVPGRVCYQARVSGNPDGEVRFVQEL